MLENILLNFSLVIRVPLPMMYLQPLHALNVTWLKAAKLDSEKGISVLTIATASNVCWYREMDSIRIVRSLQVQDLSPFSNSIPLHLRNITSFYLKLVCLDWSESKYDDCKFGLCMFKKSLCKFSAQLGQPVGLRHIEISDCWHVRVILNTSICIKILNFIFNCFTLYQKCFYAILSLFNWFLYSDAG